MSVLGTGTSALLAFQRALNTVGHNVANVATPGYSRQRVDMEARPGYGYGIGAGGQGVNVQSLQRLADGLAFARQVDSSGELGRLQQLSSSALRLDKLMSDTSTGISQPWSNFFAASSGVSADPSSAAARATMIGAAQGLAERWSALDGQLERMGQDNNLAITGAVDKANALAEEIAGLNRTISTVPGAPSPDLLDQRDRRLDELAKLVGVTTTLQDNGALNVFTSGGQPLVVDAKSNRLTLQSDPFRADRLNLALEASGGNRVTLPEHAVSGEIGGLFEFRNRVLEPARAELGRLASAFAGAINAQQAAGIDYAGNPGQALFSVRAPHVAAHAGNTGSAVLDARIDDLGALQAQNIVLRHDGAQWNATRSDTGEAVAMTGDGSAGNPLNIGGILITVGGTPASGDRFLLQPTEGAAASLKLTTRNPEHIAAAQPLKMLQSPANLGGVTGASSQITDGALFAGFTGASVEFLDDTQYTVDGNGPFAFTPGQPINGDGWSLTLQGAPAAGDRFDLGRTPAHSSDNGNALALRGLDQQGLLSGGRLGLTDAMTQLTGQVAGSASHAKLSHQAQSALHAQAAAAVDSAAGVNLDEEAADMLRFQQAYMAAAQIIATSDQMFQSLLAAVRR